MPDNSLAFFLKRIVVSFSGIAIPAGATRFAFSSAKARAQTIAPSGLFEKLSAFLETPGQLCGNDNKITPKLEKVKV